MKDMSSYKKEKTNAIKPAKERGSLEQMTLYHTRATQGTGEGYRKEILLLSRFKWSLSSAFFFAVFFLCLHVNQHEILALVLDNLFIQVLLHLAVN